MTDSTVVPSPATGARPALWAAVLGSGMAFLDATVVNVALPSIATDLHAGLAGLQWVLDGYLVTLTALLLLGGSLGDRFGRRRIFRYGICAFTAASMLCGLAPTTEVLIMARALQGVGGALLVPGSLALLSAATPPERRSAAVGAWSGLTGVASAVGPLMGGWLVDAASWRWVFLLNLPLAFAVLALTRAVAETADEHAPPHLDLPGAATAAAGLALLTGGLITGGGGWSPPATSAVACGAALLGGFVLIELKSRGPMLPPELFRSAQFVGANLVTLAVYGALGGALFLVVVNLRVAAGYSALGAGAALLPITLIMLALSARMGALAQRTGPRLPMTVGPLVMAGGLVWLSHIGPGALYATSVLPAVVLFGLGLSVTVAPLTAAVLASVGEHHLGIGSATNNAAARLASLLAVAVLPAVSGVSLRATSGGTMAGYQTAMMISAALCTTGAVIAVLLIRESAPARATVQPSVLHPCHDPCRGQPEGVAA